MYLTKSINFLFAAYRNTIKRYWIVLLLMSLLPFNHHLYHHHHQQQFRLIIHQLNRHLKLHQKGLQVFQLERFYQGVQEEGTVIGVTAKLPQATLIPIEVLLKLDTPFFFLPPLKIIQCGGRRVCARWLLYFCFQRGHCLLIFCFLLLELSIFIHFLLYIYKI